jgi:hypothetical protein
MIFIRIRILLKVPDLTGSGSTTLCGKEKIKIAISSFEVRQPLLLNEEEKIQMQPKFGRRRLVAHVSYENHFW